MVVMDNLKVDGVWSDSFESAQAFNMMPETTKVRNHLEKYRSITQAEATSLYGITRLAAVIYKLRYKQEPKMDIKMTMCYGKNRFGKNVQYGQYFI